MDIEVQIPDIFHNLHVLKICGVFCAMLCMSQYIQVILSPHLQHTALANCTDRVLSADECGGWKGLLKMFSCLKALCLTSLKFNTDGGRWIESMDRLEQFRQRREQIYEQSRVFLKQGGGGLDSKKGRSSDGEMPEITVREWAEVGYSPF